MILLDTHTALWWLADDPRLSHAAVQAVEASDAEAYLSAVVTWEIAIKRSLGKLNVPDRPDELLLAAGVLPLAITIQHTRVVEKLPWHHRDPFDRLLIAQAQAEGASVVTADQSFAAYDIDVIW